MRSSAIFALCALSAVACGRGVSGESLNANLGDEDAGRAAGDGQVIGSDAADLSGDASIGLDASIPRLDAGGLCDDDCDCAVFEACIAGECRIANRPNLCEDAGPGPTDSGQPDSGRRRDGGMRRDAGMPPDPDAGPSSSTPVGAECQGMPNACGMDGFCIEEMNGFPGGYCSEECGPSSMCPGDAVCRRFGPMNAVCLDGCQSNSDCRTGYACIQLGLMSDRVCWPINEGSMNPMGAPVGDMCTADDDCNQGLTCLDPMGPGWNDGYCTLQFCDVQNNPCPSGSLCYNFPGLFSLCLAECPSGGSQSTCRPGYYCLGPTGSPGVCTTN